MIDKARAFSALSLGFTFSLMMIPVSILEFFLSANGADELVYYRRLFTGLGFNFLFCFFIPFALFILPAVLRKILFLICAVTSVIFVTASALHLKIYDQLIAAPTLTVLLDTDLKEATEYARFYSSGTNIAIVLASVIVMVTIATWAWRLINSVSLAEFSRFYAAGAFLILIIFGNIGWNKIYFTLGNIIPFVIQIGGDVMATRSEYKKMIIGKPQNSGAELVDSTKSPMTHLIIIGESATPSHMSLYGYERETNPLLNQSFGDFKFFLSQDACSSKNVTYASIADIMLGGGPLTFDERGIPSPNMMSIFRDAGYATYWISNQPGVGYGSMVSFWSATVDRSQFLNTRDYRIGYDFDDILLPSVESALKETEVAKIIVVHMMGSHPGYDQRYPKHFKRWDDAAEVPNSVSRRQDPGFDKTKYNTYDNSLLYSDYILSSIVAAAAKYNAASIVYFSDHGQNLGEKSDHLGHSTSNGPRQGFEVPLMFWLNTSVLSHLHLALVNFESNLKKPFSLERLQYTLFDLYGIKLSATLSSKNLFSHDYQVSKRHCDGMAY